MADIRAFHDTQPVLQERVYVDPSSVLVGDIQVGDDSSIWPLVAARGDVNFIRIGQRTNIQDGTILHVTRRSPGNPDGHPLIIGNDVTVGHHCMLHGCQLGNRILVGMSAVVMDDVIVEDDVIIGAGSVVPPGKRLESGFLYVGSPVQKKRPLNESEQSFLSQSAQNYVDLKNDYLMDVHPVS
ncbi:MAG: gamma carbonic anhydrase family protein [Idiomarina sp.]|jgi:carbonic anhydrase/acetyltransferase-like protein (isoleucine patch superfamily)|uniref:gamma carbonic anhydrase family protein n=1 Tax=Idiomarina sp. TaxID=1874361 RepID=UPI000C109510|nr:gamma carbonic anhydrase family protein [Idiomarina sp.]MAK71754.1 gamma carbonic anhydrase family protein [Idiomarinaceae bacterium]MBL4742960.1 gamma carbonic anhydrase family protein [Idiomarina sp.]MBT41837.1 gamma carbonic anhydrase family protein [Idiomarina sp.]PHQ72735.1 MAG: gamma carbonic anhydrase family protein [Idiomarina sp.]HAD47576.1 gamma carbonic anhydrase family protein [Idiomarina sp.]